MKTPNIKSFWCVIIHKQYHVPTVGLTDYIKLSYIIIIVHWNLFHKIEIIKSHRKISIYCVYSHPCVPSAILFHQTLLSTLDALSIFNLDAELFSFNMNRFHIILDAKIKFAF